MSEEWTQVTRHHWRKARQTPYGLLLVEIMEVHVGEGYLVQVRTAVPNEGLTVGDISSWAEAQEVGDALLVQFSGEPPPGIEEEVWPIRP